MLSKTTNIYISMPLMFTWNMVDCKSDNTWLPDGRDEFRKGFYACRIFRHRRRIQWDIYRIWKRELYSNAMYDFSWNMIFIIAQDTYYCRFFWKLLLLYAFILFILQIRTTCVVAILLVTVGGIVATHSLEARPVDTGDDVDFGAGPSVSGITAGTGAALRSPRCLTAFDVGIARWRIAREQRWWWHYGNYRDHGSNDDWVNLPIFRDIFSLRSPIRVRRAGPARTPGKLCDAPACRTCTCKWYTCERVFNRDRLRVDVVNLLRILYLLRIGTMRRRQWCNCKAV